MAALCNLALLSNASSWRRIRDDSRCHENHKSHQSARLPTSLSPSLFAVRMSPSSSAHALTLCGYSQALLLYGLFRSMPVAVEVTNTLTNSEHWPSFACPPSMSDMRPVPRLNTRILVTCRQQVAGYRQYESFGHNAESLQNTCRLKYITKSYIFIKSYVYWTVHHCDSWRIRDQLDVTCYFISLLMWSTCFGH